MHEMELPAHIDNLALVETLYEQFLENPDLVSPGWREYFETLKTPEGITFPKPFETSFPSFSLFNPPGGKGASVAGGPDGRLTEHAGIQHQVDQLIRNYRVRGHRLANVNPLGMPKPELPELNPGYYGLGEEHNDLEFYVDSLAGGGFLPLRQIIEALQKTYCNHIGAQFMHIDDLSVREWLQRRMETTGNRIKLNRNSQLRILTRLTDAVLFEEFIQRKYLGAKRFSLEGGESLIPLMDLAIEKAGAQGIEEMVIGMAHRGRINVLANIMQKSPSLIFSEFEDKNPGRYLGGGDVKYHLGYHCDWKTLEGKPIHLALCFNPSHLEYVNPVAMGQMRAKMDRLGDAHHERGMVLLVHGDASVIGEGVVQETLTLSELEAYGTGGVLHVIINNQIGFTTGPEEGRSSVYASDVAKMLQAPIFHVNGENPEAVAQVVELAMEFRKTFKRDVFIDMYCYRRYGHNETDEPTFTQPVMYRRIEQIKSVRANYLEHLLELKEIGRPEADAIEKNRKEKLEKDLESLRADEYQKPSFRPSILGTLWRRYRGGADRDVPEVETGVGVEQLAALLTQLTRTPEMFEPHPKFERLFDLRRKMAAGRLPLDWAAAEALAFATLATEGVRVRLSGQDSIRGTFSHRHAVLYDSQSGKPYQPFMHLSDTQAPVEIWNSPLSEAGVLGFEYGYSIACPDGLVMWEAQFGDFCNAAQVIIDQFISSAEDKWKSLSGLTLLLPHGFEGMGPEHSSCRLERFLQLAAEDNLQVVYPTTPAQIFHVLRRQVHRPLRKPLIILSPKSLLRHPLAVSGMSELSRGRFQRIIPDESVENNAPPRILLCSGKVYYDLLQQREERKQENLPLIRLEQLYPLQEEDLETALSPYRTGTPVYWVQEEPENMGAWRYLRCRFGEHLLGKWPFHRVSRPESASPATGSPGAHQMEQKQLLQQAFQV